MSDSTDVNEVNQDPQAEDILRAKVSTRIYLEGGGDLYIEVYSNDTERSIASLFQGLEFLKVYKEFSMTPIHAPAPQIPQQATPVSATPTPTYATPTTTPATTVAAPQKVATTAVAPPPPVRHEEETYQVASIAYEKIVPSKGGEAKPYLRIKTPPGTKFSTYGIRAWPEVIPEEIMTQFEAWEYGIPYAPPPNMANMATVDGKRVSRFFPN